jgi:hypothetical protein
VVELVFPSKNTFEGVGFLSAMCRRIITLHIAIKGCSYFDLIAVSGTGRRAIFVGVVIAGSQGEA